MDQESNKGIGGCHRLVQTVSTYYKYPPLNITNHLGRPMLTYTVGMTSIGLNIEVATDVTF